MQQYYKRIQNAAKEEDYHAEENEGHSPHCCRSLCRFIRCSRAKEDIAATVDRISPDLIAMSDFIHDNPELGNKKYKAVELLTGYLVQNGF